MTVKIVGSEFSYSVPKLSLMRTHQNEVAFVGRSNAGKSSLINALCGKRSLAKTSKTPGRTRHAVVYQLDVIDRAEQKGLLTLVDLPGFGFASMSKTEAAACEKLIFSYLQKRVPLRLIVLIMDIRRTPDERERHIIHIAKERDIDLLLVLTKSDKLAPSKRKPAQKKTTTDAGLEKNSVLLHSTADAITTTNLLERII